ncbi:MAG: lysophospholipid acyltransferase family protein [Bacteroidales bacterium]|nr:lysophospholipid acyltransferase family protein [Bacteroidales bacterium]
MRILYWLFSGFAWLVSILPGFLLYTLSGFACFVLNNVVAYRKQIIKDNLRKSFPEYSEREISAITRTYYQHLADLVIEVIKTPGLSADQIKSRFTFLNPEVLHNIKEKGKSVILLTAHLGNWEWLGPGIQLNFPEYTGFAVIKPLSNPFFDKYINDLRRLHTNDSIIPFKQTLRYMIRNKDKLTLTLFAADQTPHKSEIGFQTYFLNRQTPYFTGFEKIAKMLDQAVVFANVYRTRRGHYEVEFQLISERPAETGEYEITLKYVRLLEKAIRERPYNWLWSHRRWKYAPKPESVKSST